MCGLSWIVRHGCLVEGWSRQPNEHQQGEEDCRNESHGQGLGASMLATVTSKRRLRVFGVLELNGACVGQCGLHLQLVAAPRASILQLVVVSWGRVGPHPASLLLHLPQCVRRTEFKCPQCGHGYQDPFEVILGMPPHLRRLLPGYPSLGSLPSTSVAARCWFQ